MRKIIVVYADRKTNDTTGCRTFVGKDFTEAMILAANYQKTHPELVKTTIMSV